MKIGIKLLTIAVAIVANFFATTASASSLLYRNDYVVGTDYLGQAISNSSFSVTATQDSLSTFNLNDYSVVVYANQNFGVPTGDIDKLNAYIAAGGSVIFNDWTGNAFGEASATGSANLTTLTLGSQFSGGISGPLSLSNPGWGTFSVGLTGGIAAATFENGDIAIAIGNGGRTIYNGFLSDTVESEKLYSNQLASLVTAVPEPETYALMLTGLGVIGAVARRRKAKQTA